MFKKLWNKITGKEDHSMKEQSLEIEQQELPHDSSEPNELTHDEMLHEELMPEEMLHDEPVLEDLHLDQLSQEKISHREEDALETTVSDIANSEAMTTKNMAKDEPVEEFSSEEHPKEQFEQEHFKEEVEQETLEEEPLEKADFEQVPTLEEEQLEQDSTLEEEQKPKKGFFKKLFEGLDKTRKNITDKIDNLINNYGKIDDELFDELEEILIMSDISMDTSLALIAGLREELVKRKITDASLVKSTLRDVIVNFLNTEEEAKISDHYPTIILVIGVNGAGKTTTIGKLANKYKTCGKSVILAAADTFRAAAIDQLQVWGNRSGVRVIAHSEGSDPSAVIFDAINAAKSSKTDILICDTAGRLHNKVNLMNELNKMFRIIEREYPEANKEVLIVLDATTGQNALNQAKLFKEVADITGLVLTKLDGAAKGGFVLSIKHDLGIPLKLIGVGEGIDDLQEFKPVDFANALMDLEQKSEV